MQCDETKPVCHACTRLSLQCTYGRDYVFRGVDDVGLKSRTGLWTKASADDAPSSTQSSGTDSENNQAILPPSTALAARRLDGISLYEPLVSDDLAEFRYLQHYDTHVKHILPRTFMRFANSVLATPHLRHAILCLSASNLAMLDTSVQTRWLPDDEFRSVYSPVANIRHLRSARHYHDLVVQHGPATLARSLQDLPSMVVAKVLLAYYHHASTNHFLFRLAVWDTTLLVLYNKEAILQSADGAEALQVWFRLCTSHKLAKPPSLLLDGEGSSCFGPNINSPSATDDLQLACVLGMSIDDLIYDILIKTLELRSRMTVFHCVAGVRNMSTNSRELSSLVHNMLSRLMGRTCSPEEFTEADACYVQGRHLLDLFEIQRKRLQVWRTRLSPAQLLNGLLPGLDDGDVYDQRTDNPNTCFVTQQDKMNAMYYLLCQLMIGEARDLYASCDTGRQQSIQHRISEDDVAHSICRIVETLDFSVSNVSDVYTFSLVEVLVQLVFSIQSDDVFQHILEVVFPRMEAAGRGFEHSHYPTHLAKRIIAFADQEYKRSRKIVLALPAVSETITKLALLDIYYPSELVACGHDLDGKFFIHKVSLP